MQLISIEPVQPISNTASIFIKLLNDKTAIFDFHCYDKIKTMKDKIEAEEGIAIDQQRLMFKGKQLENHRTFADYNIEKDDSVVLLLRLHGGSSFRGQTVENNTSNENISAGATVLCDLTSTQNRFVKLGKYDDGFRKDFHCVIKSFNKLGAVYKDEYFNNDLKLNQKCIEILHHFNSINITKLRANNGKVWDDTTTGEKALVEPFLEKWKKYNSNSGWYNDDNNDEWNLYFQSLSHYSYHISNGDLLICDIQAGQDELSGEMVISDPVIHSTSHAFPPTDAGQNGINAFFKHHVCNNYCDKRWLLPTYTPTWLAPVKATSFFAPSSFASLSSSSSSSSSSTSSTAAASISMFQYGGGTTNNRLIVININGTSDNNCSCGCGTWSAHWRKHTGSKRETCCVLGCAGDRQHLDGEKGVFAVGAHVRVLNYGSNRKWWIVPFCKTHNHHTYTYKVDLESRVVAVSADVSDCKAGKTATITLGE